MPFMQFQTRPQITPLIESIDPFMQFQIRSIPIQHSLIYLWCWQASVEVDVVDPERIVVLSDSSSSESDDGDSGDDEEEDGGGDAGGGGREDSENVKPKKGEEGRGDDRSSSSSKKEKEKEKGERPPPVPLSPRRTPLQEPLCMQTLRFMASLRRVREPFCL